MDQALGGACLSRRGTQIKDDRAPGRLSRGKPLRKRKHFLIPIGDLQEMYRSARGDRRRFRPRVLLAIAPEVVRPLDRGSGRVAGLAERIAEADEFMLALADRSPDRFDVTILGSGFPAPEQTCEGK